VPYVLLLLNISGPKWGLKVSIRIPSISENFASVG